MSLIKTSMLTFLVLGLCLTLFPLSVSGPHDNSVSQSETPAQTAGKSQQQATDHALEALPEAKPIVRLTAVATPEIQLPALYPELEQIIALENLPASEALTGLQPLLLDADLVIRLAALQALADMTHPHRSIHLIALLQDPEALVRIAALEALGDGQDTTPISSIEALVFDDDAEVRIAAIGALAALENADAVYTLAGLLGDTDSRIRGHAVNALGEIGGELAIGYLRQARYDSASNIRANADAILQELGAPITDR